MLSPSPVLIQEGPISLLLLVWDHISVMGLYLDGSLPVARVFVCVGPGQKWNCTFQVR